MTSKEISFIIPALNEETHIGYVLDSIRENIENSFQYEVIVVDNGSTDRTVEIAEKKGAICRLAPGCTISSLRNMGALDAISNILVFLDADVYLVKNWVNRIGMVMTRLHDQPQIITGSFCGVSEENNWIERIWFAPRTVWKENPQYMNSGHLIIHRSLFLKLGGFSPELETGEDYELCARARGIGAWIENDPELKVVHAGYPKRIKYFFARERWHARGDYKSFKTLTSSKPALVSLANLFMVVTCLIGMFIFSQSWFMLSCVYIVFLISLSVAASIHRCRCSINSGFIGIVLLYIVYFTARTVSIVDVTIQSFKDKMPVHVSV